MSISQLPIQLPPPSSSHPIVSASVTRILTLANFSADLKTRDLQSIFTKWSEERGGFKIKWIDDITALAVFADATVAKRAYLSLLLDPPAILPPPATIRPYDGPDAQAIIHSVNARTHGHAGTNNRASFAGTSNTGMQQGGMRGTNGATFSIPPPPMGISHGRASSVSTVLGPSGGGTSILGSSAPTGSGFGASNQRMGSFSTSNAPNGSTSSYHARGSSSAGSRTRSSVSGVLSGFQASGGLDRSSLTGGGPGGRLPTHMEAESPIQSHTPTTTAQTNSAPPRYPPTFRSSSSDSLSNTSSSRDDLTSPPLDVVGGMAAEGGPGGRPRMTDGAKRMVGHSIGARLGGTSSNGNGNGNGAGNGTATGGLADFNKIRRESLDAASAEKALRQVEKALEGLGVTATIDS